MSHTSRRLTTEEQRERLHQARRRGDLCAGCGRVLRDGETVYVEKFEQPWGNYLSAPVGVECASEGLLHDTQGQQPERCAGCGRGVVYSVVRAVRRQALCSRACGAQVQAAKRLKAED